MDYYPLFLNLKGRPVVVIGGGAVAERKVSTLLQAGAAVTVISPKLTPRLTRWGAEQRLTVYRRAYRKGDLNRALLAFAATEKPVVNEKVAREAERKRLLFNRADQSGSEGFIVPALFSKGGMTIAVSSGGKSPAAAKQIRDCLEDCLTAESRQWVEVLSQIKRRLIQKKVPFKTRREILSRLAESELPTFYQRRQTRAAHELIFKLSGLRPADLSPAPANGRENGAATRQKRTR